MRTPDGIFFAPGIRFKELNLESSERLADALHLRSAKWFLQPAATLVESSAFASGVVLTCFVDAAAEFAGVGFVEWFKAAVPDLASRDPRRTEKTFADSVYEDVRNGLVHHARLSRGAEFSQDLDGVLKIVNDVLIVNPRRLCEAVEGEWLDFLASIRNDAAVHKAVADRIRRNFRVDFDADRRFS